MPRDWVIVGQIRDHWRVIRSVASHMPVPVECMVCHTETELQQGEWRDIVECSTCVHRATYEYTQKLYKIMNNIRPLGVDNESEG